MEEDWLAGLAAAGEDPQTASRLNRWVPLMYEELRAFAGKLLSDKAAQVTLQPTSLVHEAYLRLRDQRQVDWQDRLHFFRIAARVMRRVLVDHFRNRVAQKRGGLQMAIALEEDLAAASPSEIDVLAVDRLLTDLEALDAQQARIVELRFFAGLTVEETAEALGISKATVKRDWAVAKAWMAKELKPPETPATPESHGR
jgi:RNA polymerase sigma factor (TIGR02999 family)